jgi:DNA polymerase I
MPELSRFLVQEVEIPLIPVVADVENNGYLVDVQFFHELRKRLEPEIAETLARIRETGGETFNPDSPPQLAELLYEKLGLPIIKITDKGAPSTDKDTLKLLQPKHAVVRDILRYRELRKNISTYCSIPDKVSVDGRLYVQFNQHGAATGRFSSSSIIQTLPKDDKYGIRRGFRSPNGRQIVGADYCQQELNVLAQLSGDENMLTALKTGIDLHGLAAVKVFNLDCQPNEVAEKYPEKRRYVKTIQFGLIYGKSAYGLAEDLGIEKDAAEELIDDYFAQFPAVQTFLDQVHEALFRRGFVADVFGRRRYFPTVLQKRPQKRYEQMTEQEKELVRKINAAKREAQNFMIQGASATVTKLAMLRCHRRICEHYGDDVKMILTLHDELQFEVRDEVVTAFAAELPGLMCDLGLEKFGFNLPFEVDVKVGPSWGELTKKTGA